MGAYQRKLEEMAALAPEMALTVVVPPFWRDERGITPLERIHVHGYRIEEALMLFNGQFHLHFYPEFGEILRRFRPDIVHIDEEPYNLATFHANWLARRSGAKTLWFSWQNLRRKYPPPWVWMERYNLHHIDYALAGSQTAGQVWRAKGYTGPLAVIPQFGVDPHLFTPPTTPRATTAIHIAYVGRLVPEKGIDVLLRALVDLAGNWELTIQGSGPEETYLRQLAHSLGLADRVTFRALISSIDMPNFYRQVDILVLPSRSRANWTEQFGRVLIEAMACGVCVVGSNTGEIPHVIGKAGVIFPEDDAVALQSVLDRLIRFPSLRLELRQYGRERVLSHFTQRGIAQDTVGIYKEILQ